MRSPSGRCVLERAEEAGVGKACLRDTGLKVGGEEGLDQ
jgi:hypothetical protein